jgi:hypothetical protein
MLKQILSITGRPGLFKIVGQGKNVIFVEDLTSGKRFPAHMREKIVSLGDIAMYTDSGDTPLGEIYERLYAKIGGEKVDVKSLIENKGLAAKFEEIVPDYDKNRVYTSDLKKFFTWYNILIDAGFTSFVAKEAEAESEEKAEKED